MNCRSQHPIKRERRPFWVQSPVRLLARQRWGGGWLLHLVWCLLYCISFNKTSIFTPLPSWRLRFSVSSQRCTQAMMHTKLHSQSLPLMPLRSELRVLFHGLWLYIQLAISEDNSEVLNLYLELVVISNALAIILLFHFNNVRWSGGWDTVLQKRLAWALFVLLLSTILCC